MKIKNSHLHHSNNNISTSNSFQLQSNNFSFQNQSSISNFNQMSSQSLHNEDTLINDNTILTRSAASRQNKSNTNSAAINQNSKRLSNHHHTTSSLNHQHHQHVVGKIVKPIPVRPISSSSSSTHSSISNHNSNKVAAILANEFVSTLSQTDSINYINNNSSSDSTGASGFSLIAKYFASFPATRLKSTTNNDQTGSSSQSQSPILVNQPTLNVIKTPFLPFKKQQQGTLPIIAQNIASSSFKSTNNLSSQSALFTSLASDSYNNDYMNQPISFNLRSHSHNNHANNTDHLCTNFKRLIKINDNNENNDNIITAAASPLQTNSNTPTGLLDSESEQSCNLYTLNTDNSQLNTTLTNNNNVLAANSDPPILGQITMETRSTRKFLIKHHPYLQISSSTNNSQQSSMTSNNQGCSMTSSTSSIENNGLNNLINQPRPSINLIKMKKLLCKSSYQQCHYQNNSCDYDPSLLSNSATLVRTSRHSNRLNNIDLGAGDNYNNNNGLVKFTDIAPPIISSKGQTQNTSIIRTRRQSSKLASNSITSLQPVLSGNKKAIKNSNYKIENDEKDEKCDYLDEDLLVNNYDECSYIQDDDEEIDDSQEDSSGYYSSYHSCDLISSSGGSSGGDLINRHNNLKLPINLTNTSSTPSNNTNIMHNQNNNDNKPHHHYQTRLNIQNQLLTNGNNNNNQNPNNSISTSRRNRSTTPTVINSNNKTNTNNYNTPTTRLRYQQQLAAARLASKTTATSDLFINKSIHINNDLDLDQIEND